LWKTLVAQTSLQKKRTKLEEEEKNEARRGRKEKSKKMRGEMKPKFPYQRETLRGLWRTCVAQSVQKKTPNKTKQNKT
jgi:hypothetical protein